jgi:lysophospholipid acyltransferase
MPIKFIADTFQRPADEVTLFVSIIVCFLVCIPMPYIRNVALRKIYSTVGGLLMSFFTFGIYTLVLIPYNMIGYLSMSLMPRFLAPYVVILTTGSLLTAGNYYEMITEDTTFNVSILMMITFCKQWMLAINYRDGAGDIESWLNSREKARALKNLPSLFDYVNYIFNLSSSVCGPCFEYKEWDEFINLKANYSSMVPQSCIVPALNRFLHGLLFS